MVRGHRFFSGSDDARIPDRADADFLLEQAPIVRTFDRLSRRAALLSGLRHVGVLNEDRSWQKERLALHYSPLEISSAFHGFHHGDFVGVLEVGADRDTDTDARDADTERFYKLREIHGRGFAFRVRVRCDDDFFDRAALEALDQIF